MSKPDLNTVPSFYHKYINLVEEDNLQTALENNTEKAVDFLAAIPEHKWDHRYAEGKWSIKELVQHIIDAERIFSYRALCFARGEKQSLPGFEENDYAAASKAEQRSKTELLEEFSAVRKATEALFGSFDEEQQTRKGIANNNPISVDAIGFITVGHLQHHLNIIRERYLA